MRDPIHLYLSVDRLRSLLLCSYFLPISIALFTSPIVGRRSHRPLCSFGTQPCKPANSRFLVACIRLSLFRQLHIHLACCSGPAGVRLPNGLRAFKSPLGKRSQASPSGWPAVCALSRRTASSAVRSWRPEPRGGTRDGVRKWARACARDILFLESLTDTDADTRSSG